ncbi:hypothetical protein CO655_03830 [Rhizobium sp. M1]|nr:hypothetical protein CO655_03830 [Rhizobium sp. M1]
MAAPVFSMGMAGHYHRPVITLHIYYRRWFYLAVVPSAKPPLQLPSFQALSLESMAAAGEAGRGRRVA